LNPFENAKGADAHTRLDERLDEKSDGLAHFRL
jgi:hypothetical protein